MLIPRLSHLASKCLLRSKLQLVPSSQLTHNETGKESLVGAPPLCRYEHFSVSGQEDQWRWVRLQCRLRPCHTQLTVFLGTHTVALQRLHPCRATQLRSKGGGRQLHWSACLGRMASLPQGQHRVAGPIQLETRALLLPWQVEGQLRGDGHLQRGLGGHAL